MNSSQRLLSLDIMRGLTIAGMILVNNPGSWAHIYGPLKHSTWIGCTPTDLIFPFFLIIMGIAMWISFKKFDQKITRIASLKIIRRISIIFLIGFLLNAFPFYNTAYSQFRILGVLQRIAIAYGISSFIVLSIDKKYLWFVIGGVLMSYWFIIYFFGGEEPYGMQTNIVGKVDAAILGTTHMWNGLGFPFDPEGLLSSFPVIATVIIGYLMGSLITETKSKIQVVKKLAFMGLVGTVGGYLWGSAFPIIKSLWTSSYVVYTAGWAALVMSGLIWLVDNKRIKKWSCPAIVFGMNPLFLYIFAWVLTVVFETIISFQNSVGEMISLKNWMYQELLKPLFGKVHSSFIYALIFVFINWLMGLFLYKRKLFIKI